MSDAAMFFKPEDWYWYKNSEEVFSSDRVKVVSERDSAFREWKGLGRVPTPWPQDDDGEQTTAALQQVLDAYGLHASLDHYASGVRWAREIEGITAEVGKESVPVSTKRGDDRAALDKVYQDIKDDIRKDGSYFKFADGVMRPATNDEMMEICLAVRKHVQKCFDTEGDVLVKLQGGSITTKAGVDAAFKKMK